MLMIKTRGILVVLLLLAVVQYSYGAFQCYQCSDCGTSWNPGRARIVLTEGGNQVCVKRVVNGRVNKDYLVSCTPGNGVYCCDGDLCNSTNSKYHVNSILLIVAVVAAGAFAYRS